MLGMALERLIEAYRRRAPLTLQREAIISAARDERAALMAGYRAAQELKEEIPPLRKRREREPSIA